MIELNKLDIIAKRELWNDSISLTARIVNGSESTFAQPVVFQTQEAGFIVHPFFEMDITASQKLMDQLWDCGLRPSEGTGSAGSLKATENHLNDMRHLVFKTKPNK